MAAVNLDLLATFQDSTRQKSRRRGQHTLFTMAVNHVETDDARRILCVGLVCLDIINVCPCYPKEDEDVRAEKQQRKRGGNAGNTLTVLRLLDREGEFLGTLGSGSETQ